MTVKIIVKYQKLGATFADGSAAYADKNSLLTASANASVENTYADLLASGVLLQSISKTWDQENQILTIEKLVTDVNAYSAGVKFDLNEIGEAANAAGWQLLGSFELVV